MNIFLSESCLLLPLLLNEEPLLELLLMPPEEVTEPSPNMASFWFRRFFCQMWATANTMISWATRNMQRPTMIPTAFKHISDGSKVAAAAVSSIRVFRDDVLKTSWPKDMSVGAGW